MKFPKTFRTPSAMVLPARRRSLSTAIASSEHSRWPPSAQSSTSCLRPNDPHSYVRDLISESRDPVPSRSPVYPVHFRDLRSAPRNEVAQQRTRKRPSDKNSGPHSERQG